MMPSVDVVVPTAGRPALVRLLSALAPSAERLPGCVLLVDDRRDRSAPVVAAADVPPQLAGRVEVIAGRGAGPAAARNAGWRCSGADWIAFLDDDVVPDADWGERLLADLGGQPPRVAGSQGRLRVPLPGDRRPTDWERNVAGLEHARWATADLAYRRAALAEVGGFDERFGRAYREDADLGLRLVDAGWAIVRGERAVTHPVGPADRWVSVRLQAGNADDVLMDALHGPGWRSRAGAPRGRLRRHLATTTAGLAGFAGAVAGRRGMAAAGLAGWLVGTAELAWTRIAPGPRSRAEVATMLLTSAVLPAAATLEAGRGLARRRWLLADTARAPRPSPAAPTGSRGGRRQPGSANCQLPTPKRPAAVLLDRDGTLIHDVPYNGDPAKVEPIPGARAALDRLRAAGVPVALVSNQSGVGRGLISRADVEAVNRRVEELLGPLGPWAVCHHAPDDGCDCRKPAPGLVRRAAAELGVAPERCAMIGDIGADVEAAHAAGARAVLVPTPRTRREEVESAPVVAPDIETAVELLIGGRR